MNRTMRRTTTNLDRGSIAARVLGIWMVWVCAAAGCALPAQAQQAHTTFHPERHGFAFVNTFKNDFIPELNWQTGGLCGGMAYAALDYYFADRPIPRQTYRPANGTALHKLIYDRQVRSLERNLPEWGNLRNNVGGIRNVELFKRSLNGREGGALANLRRFIDEGKPVPLGLKGGPKTGDHQVLAIGYDLGGYDGSYGPRAAGVRIVVYDPNHPNATRTLVPDLSQNLYRYAEGGSEHWRSYFVDTKYRPKTPPEIPDPTYPDDGKLHELVLAFHTGNDDLRGDSRTHEGQANVDLEIVFVDGHREHHPNINLGARWLPNYTENARVELQRPVRREEIRKLILTDTFRGGVNHDTWNLDSLRVMGLENGRLVTIGRAGSKRFTIKDRRLEVPITLAKALAGQIGELGFTFHTGGDALRGGRANLNIEIHYADGSVQTAPNVNQGQRWANGSTHQVSVHLDRAVRPQQIRRIVLVSTASPGSNSDQWKMASVQVSGSGNGVHREIASHGFFLFTAKTGTLALTVHP